MAFGTHILLLSGVSGVDFEALPSDAMVTAATFLDALRIFFSFRISFTFFCFF